jgi:hypothetical protein
MLRIPGGESKPGRWLQGLLACALLQAAALLALSSPASAGVRNGVDVPGESPGSPVGEPRVIVAPPVGATVINFDDLTAPCLFLDSSGPLTSHYSNLGVNFSGPAAGSGGVVLNECGGFGVTGQSSPNFLAFNTLALGSLPGAGSPIGPETISFVAPVDSVQINVGSADAGTVTLTCFVGAVLAGTTTVSATGSLSTLSLHGHRITNCTLAFTGTALVADDLAFVASPSDIPALNGWGLFVLALMVAAFGAHRLTARAGLP